MEVIKKSNRVKKEKEVPNKNLQISKYANGILHIMLVILSAIVLLPVFYMISISLTDEMAILKEGYKLIPSKWSLNAYRYLFADGKTILDAYIVTIAVTLVGTVSNLTIHTMFAYPLSRKNFRFKKVFTIFILITMLFSGGFVPQYIINVNILKLRNSFLALFLPSLGSGFTIIVMRTYFKTNIPDEIIEAAQIDGVSQVKIFLKIALPLAVPIIACMGIFDIFGFWNNWQNSMYYISDQRLFTLQYIMQRSILNLQYIQQALAQGNLNMQFQTVPQETVRMAMVIVGVGPIILAYPFFQKYFIQGLTVGSVKG